VLCIGNTSLFGGVFAGGKLAREFRVPRAEVAALRAELARAGRIARVELCSVVPDATVKILRIVRRETGIIPAVLTAGSPHGLTIAYRDPRRLGTDRLAAALGARVRFPGKNVIVVDCGTATTVTALRAGGVLAGGAIFPGLSLWAEALAAGTAQLPRVPMRRPRAALGRSPEEAIASGIFHGHAGAIRAVVTAVAREAFGAKPFIVIGTGGHAPRLKGEKLFTVLEPRLILLGLLASAGARFHHAQVISPH
jgi:type III pantothenate kinase